MKYVALDVETTGLIPYENQTIEIAAIVDDLCEPDRPIDELPKLHCHVPHENYFWSRFALKMHYESGLLQELLNFHSSREPIPNPKDWVPLKINSFLVSCGINIDKSVVGAGKNFASFDRLFMKELGVSCFGHRCIDPVNFFIHPTDIGLPDLNTCLSRANIATQTNHRAMDDTRMVVQLVRAGLKK